MMNDSNSTPGGGLPPDTSELFTLEDVQKAQRQFLELTDDKSHPYNDPSRPTYRDWLDYKTALHRLEVELEGGDDGLDPVQKAMAEGLEQQEQEQGARMSRARDAFEKLVGDGEEVGLEPPGDLIETEVRCLELGVMASQGKWDEVMGEVRRLIEQCPRIPSAVRQRFDLLEHIPASQTEHRLGDLDQILHGLCCEGRRRMGLPPRSWGKGEQPAEGQGMPDVAEARARIAELRATPGYMALNSDMTPAHRQIITDELRQLYKIIEDQKEGE